MMQKRDKADSALSEGRKQSAEGSSRRWSQPCRLFTVKEGVRHLTTEQLRLLESSFEAWVNLARDERTRRSRERIFIVFLVLRHTGAKLGEVLGLHERGDIDYQQGLVKIPYASEVREIPLPEQIIERIRRYAARYADEIPDTAHRASASLFDLDQGFVRRKFYEQHERTGLPKELLTPSVLRTSRAIELQCGGMPLRAVQAMLGHSKADFTAAYVALEDADLKAIIRRHLDKEYNRGTSVRNTFNGTVERLAASSVACEVVLRTASGYEVASVITSESCHRLGLEAGKAATALVKATLVVPEKAGGEPVAQARNALPGVVAEVAVDGAMAEVRGILGDGTPISALMPEERFRALGVRRGDTALFTFAASSVIIG